MTSLQMIFAFPQAGNNDFSTFLVDEKNRLAEKACRSFAAKTEPGGLTIHGESGVGKTHLLVAMGTMRKRVRFISIAPI